jgi:hypothetical protein
MTLNVSIRKIERKAFMQRQKERGKTIKLCFLTCHGNSPKKASCPPMILDLGLAVGLPHTVVTQNKRFIHCQV